MGTTFTALNAYAKKVASTDQFPNLRESDFADGWYERGEDGRHYMEVSDSPELSCTCTSAEKLFQLAKHNHLWESVGQLEGEALDSFHNGLMLARNRANLRRDAMEVCEMRGNLFMGGYNEDRLIRLLDRALELVAYCKKHKRPLSWA